MRFYTALVDNKEEILVGFTAGSTVYRLPLLAKVVPWLNFKNMNELILGYTDQVKRSFKPPLVLSHWRSRWTSLTSCRWSMTRICIQNSS